MACKLLVGYKELHLETRRLLQFSCESICRAHRKSTFFSTNETDIVSFTNVDKVLENLKELTLELAALKALLLDTANSSYQNWKDMFLLPIEETFQENETTRLEI